MDTPPGITARHRVVAWKLSPDGADRVQELRCYPNLCRDMDR
jgi:hypothetical protein